MIQYRFNPVTGDFTILITGDPVCVVAKEEHAKILTGAANANYEAAARRIAAIQNGLSELQAEVQALTADLLLESGQHVP